MVEFLYIISCVSVAVLAFAAFEDGYSESKIVNNDTIALS